jgi:hypothetical protein
MKKLLPRASLRAYLVAVVAGSLVPMVCYAAYLTIGLSRTERKAVERGLIDTAAALTSTVDRELTSSVTALEALGTSEYLDKADYRGFFGEAQRVLASQTPHG